MTSNSRYLIRIDRLNGGRKSIERRTMGGNRHLKTVPTVEIPSATRSSGLVAVVLCLLLASSASAQMATGSYTGDGNFWRTINGVGFEPDVVIIKADENMPAIIRTSNMPAWQSKLMAWNNNIMTGRIQEFGADSFTIGNTDEVNRFGWRYDWTAFEADPGRMIVGSYTGDDSYDRLIATGFSPQYVIVIPEDISQSVQRSKDMPYDFTLPLTTRAASTITSSTVGRQGSASGMM